MARTTTVIIGAGQAGLAMSHCLSESGIEHVVLERGHVAQRWRSHSWDSLHLLTPNWMTRLPGFQYDGGDPDGFMSAHEVVAFFERYATASAAPVLSHTPVHRVERFGGEFAVVSDRGVWPAPSVVLATGYCDRPAIPAASRGLAAHIRQMPATAYRRPGDLPEGGVLVVGASSTGVQLADEIQRSGRQVTLAVGRHIRLPRRYRGRDILWWLDRLGVLAERADAVGDLERSRRQPSLQLIGGPERATLDLAVLHRRGVRLVGRVLDAQGSVVHLADDLAATTAAADVKLAGILGRIDRYISVSGTTAAPAEPFNPTWPLASSAPSDLDLRNEGIRTVIWATGYRRVYRWLHVPVLDARGEIVHDGGATAEPGLYVLGMNFQRRRNSSFIDGVGDDARAIARQIARKVHHASVA